MLWFVVAGVSGDVGVGLSLVVVVEVELVIGFVVVVRDWEKMVVRYFCGRAAYCNKILCVPISGVDSI